MEFQSASGSWKSCRCNQFVILLAQTNGVIKGHLERLNFQLGVFGQGTAANVLYVLSRQ